MKRSRLQLTILLAACLAGLFFPGAARAVDWGVSSGNWNVPANWVGGFVPTSGQDAVIKNSGTALLPTGVNGTSFGTYIGFLGNGTLDISGGNLVTTNDVNLGSFAGDRGNATLSSGNWTITRYLDIGVAGTGSLVMSGGNLTASVSSIGSNTGGVGTASLSGGVWSNFNLVVGSNGVGNLTITGGLASADFTAIGGSANGVGSLTISAGTLQNTRSGVGLYVGYFGNGTLNVSNSAAVTTNDAIIGDQVARSGAANVSGGTWSNNGTLVVGNSGTGTLNISGGLVSSANATIGSQAGSRGVVNVSGGTWNTGGNLALGANGNGTLSLTDTGVVTVNGGNGTVLLRRPVGSSEGRLDIGTGGVAGTLNAAAISGGGGTLNFNHTGTVVFSANLTNNMRVNKSGAGTTILTGSNSWTAFGGSTISGGTLLINGNSTSATAAMTVATGATLGGNGSFGGQVTVESGGTLAPGSNGPGSLILASGLTLNSGSTLALEFSGTGAGQFDQLNVAGNFLAGGTLQLTINVGYAPVSGHSFFVFNNTTTPGFTSGNFTIATNLGGGLLWDTSLLQNQGVLSITGAALPILPDAYWLGQNGTAWSQANWASDQVGTPSNAPVGATSNVTFSANVPANQLSTVLDTNLTISSLKVNSSAGISGNRTLTVNGTTTVDGGALALSGINLNGRGNLTVGSNGTASLTLGNGTLSNVVGTIGNVAGSNGTVTVSGGNWTNNGTLSVGVFGTGKLNLTGGVVGSVGAVSLAANVGSNGTLNLGTGGTVGTLTSTGVVGGNGTAIVNFNHAGSMAFSQIMSGSITVNKLGTGTTTLSMANTYTGGTTITAGTVQTTNVAALGTGPLTINAGTLDPVGALTINSLTWNGGSVASELGTATDLLTVTGALTLAAGGGTFVFDPGAGFATGTPYTILSAANLTDAFLSLFAGNSLSGSAPVFTRNGINLIVTFLAQGGAVDGAVDGPLLQNSNPVGTPSNGVFTVNGSVQTGSPLDDNTIFGLIFNPGGLLEVFQKLTVTGGSMDVTGGNATLTGGTVFVPSDFNKDGGGNLNIQSLVQILGAANISTGGLFVNGVFSVQGAFTILQNAILGGNGTIIANVFNSGNVSPGNSPGTLSIIGNFTQASSGALNIELASLSNFDRLIVSGNAALAGTLNAIPFGGFAPAYGQQFTFLQAGSITGAFNTITAPNEFRGRILLNGGTATLLLAPDTYTRIAETPNQRRVAKALDTYIPATTGDRAAVSLALDLQTAAQYPGAFDQIAPTMHETVADITLEQAFTQTQLLNQRMSSVRLGARGFQAIGLNAEPLRYDKDGKSVADAKDLKSQIAAIVNPRWSTWVIGSGMFAKIDGSNQMPNLSFQSGGFLAGADYAWSENFTTGLYGGYQGTSADYGNSGDARINTTSFGGYATYTSGGFYADAVVGGGYSNYKVNRSIEFSTVNRTAASQQNGGQFTSGLNFGYDWKAAGFTFGPVFGAQYTLASISPFTETGAGALNLRVAQQNANSLRTTLGGRIAYNWNVTDKISLIPEVRMFWQHEFLENPRVIGAALDSGNGAGFNYVTAAPDRDAIFAAAGVTAQFGETWNASLYYNSSFANETTLIHTISASLGLKF